MSIIILGGTGFIGIHYARKLLSEKRTDQIYLADMKDIQEAFLFPDITDAVSQGKIKFISCDVRDYSTFDKLPRNNIELIANFAAVHREPGHEHHEYYDTNIPGANNVCRYAEEVKCGQIVFTSSIAVYEPTEAPKDEKTIPAPISAYGGSKLAAELIHQKWQEKNPSGRKLVIVRPGVVYGPSEGGNVTRMIKAIKKGFFAFVGNKKTRKASIYVKELINMIDHYLFHVPDSSVLSNAVVPQPPSMEEYVRTVKKVTGWKKIVPSLPFFLLYILSFIVAFLFGIIGKKTSINPMRVKKLRRINNIVSSKLPETGYSYCYTLETAFQDWHDEWGKDW